MYPAYGIIIEYMTARFKITRDSYIFKSLAALESRIAQTVYVLSDNSGFERLAVDKTFVVYIPYRFGNFKLCYIGEILPALIAVII